MRIVHFIGGGDEGGAKSHVLSLVKELENDMTATLVSFRTGPFHNDAVAMGIDARVIFSRSVRKDYLDAVKLVKNGRYDLIHAHGAKGNLMALLVSRKLHIPMLTTVHSDYRLDYIHSLPKRLTIGLMNTVALRKIRYHVCVSKGFRTVLTTRGFNPQGIFSVNNGIPFNNEIPPCTRKAFYGKYNIDFPENAFLIGIMARLHPVKDHATFLRAAAEMAKDCELARFVISGPGELLQQLRNQAAQLGITDKVCFTGNIAEPFDFFQNIDVNVLSSISEGFPYVILEGARFYRPTISTLVGGLKDILEHEINCLTFTPGDDTALARHFKALYQDESLRKRLGTALHDKAEATYSLANMSRDQIEIYQRVLALDRRNQIDGKRYDMTLLGYYGYRNSGDEAILESFVQTVRATRPDTTFAVLTRNPQDTRIRHEVDGCHRFNLLRMWHILRNSRVFLAGGGSLIQDNTSTRSILYYLSMLLMAGRCGARTMLFANGLGPISHEANRRRTRKVLNKLDAITLRDHDSLEEAASIGITNAAMSVTADPALLLEPASEDAVLEWMRQSGIPESTPLLGISVRNWLHREEFVQVIAKMADHACSTYGVVPVFIPMQAPSDVQVSRQVLAHMNETGLLLPEAESPGLVLGFISRCTFLVGMRLHSLIYAANRCIPMAGLIYEPKVASFLKDVSQPVLGHVESLDAHSIIQAFDDAWAQREAATLQLVEKHDSLQAAASQNARIVLKLLDQ